MSSSVEEELLKEFLYPQSGMLFKEEIIGPIFCKPKLIPLKSVTLEKLESMQQEGLEKMKQMEAQRIATEKQEAEDSAAAAAVSTEGGKIGEGIGDQKRTDIWAADES
uniref:BBSome-interacting protein 1 n=1 Tax=Panagrolaimus superbus TaxID=310955 RepID=A0A914YHL6_9BILA